MWGICDLIAKAGPLVTSHLFPVWWEAPLRYVKFLEMVSSSKAIDPQKLPPTERAAFYHSLRVHLQVTLWKKLTHEDLKLEPEQWGWKLDGTTLSF